VIKRLLVFEKCAACVGTGKLQPAPLQKVPDDNFIVRSSTFQNSWSGASKPVGAHLISCWGCSRTGGWLALPPLASSVSAIATPLKIYLMVFSCVLVSEVDDPDHL